jgi:RNA polymerase-binding transcription factor
MKHIEIQQFKQILESRRDEAYHQLHRLGNETRSLDLDARDSGDQSIATISKESLFQQNSQRLGQLRSIEAALARVDEGTYGVCASCGEDIATRRLQALPWTEHCLRCQELLEQQTSSGQAPGFDDTMWRQAG